MPKSHETGNRNGHSIAARKPRWISVVLICPFQTTRHHVSLKTCEDQDTSPSNPILCLLQQSGSKMSNLPHHNNSLPLTIHLQTSVTCSHCPCTLTDFQTEDLYGLPAHTDLLFVLNITRHNNDLHVYTPLSPRYVFPAVLLSFTSRKSNPIDGSKRTKGINSHKSLQTLVINIINLSSPRGQNK